jgi:hypothetical protein
MRRIEAQPCDGWMPWQGAREDLLSIMEPAFSFIELVSLNFDLIVHKVSLAVLPIPCAMKGH